MLGKPQESKLIFDDPSEWDEDWATDWDHLEEIAIQIEELKKSFMRIQPPYLLEIAQRQIILNLERYLGLLSHYIIEKYQ
jgi:hypothetical protein